MPKNLGFGTLAVAISGEHGATCTETSWTPSGTTQVDHRPRPSRCCSTKLEIASNSWKQSTQTGNATNATHFREWRIAVCITIFHLRTAEVKWNFDPQVQKVYKARLRTTLNLAIHNMPFDSRTIGLHTNLHPHHGRDLMRHHFYRRQIKVISMDLNDLLLPYNNYLEYNRREYRIRSALPIPKHCLFTQVDRVVLVNQEIRYVEWDFRVRSVNVYTWPLYDELQELKSWLWM